MNPMLAEFVSESRDLLQQASEALLELEQAFDQDRVNRLFRAIHTIKGASGIFSIAPFTQAVHAAEDLLDAVRAGRTELSAEIVDVVLEAMDAVSRWLEELEQDGALSAEAPALSEAVSARIRTFLPSADAPPQAGAPAAPAGPQPPAWLEAVPAETRSALAGPARDGLLWAVTYTPHESCFFSGTDPMLLVRELPDIRWMRIDESTPWPALAELDPFVCCLRFQLLACADEETLREVFLYVEDEVSLVALSPDDLGFSAPSVSAPRREAAVDLLRAQLTMLQHAGQQDDRTGWDGSAARILRGVLQQTGLSLSLPEQPSADALVVSIEAALDLLSDDQSDVVSGPLADVAIELLEQQQAALRTLVPGDLKQGRLASAVRLVSHVLQSCRLRGMARQLDGEVDEDRVVSVIGAALKALRRAPEGPQAAAEARPMPQSASPALAPAPAQQALRHLKVEVDRIDALMDLVGELVVARNALSYLADRTRDVLGQPALAKEIMSRYAVINRISEDLQGAVMQVRMMSVGHAFERFPRLVRDLSRHQGKKVRLVLSGQETEADKTIVEDLAEPLVHLVRNAIDHGIEGPDERTAAGKPAEATLHISATSTGDQVVIRVQDDGRGMDPARIRRRAFQRGLIGDEELSSMPDEDAIQLIFTPGFSTAETISELSGRGVGMDVVRAMVSRARGSVSVSSTLGEGSTISLTLPLSMAISRIMKIEVAGQLFGLPMSCIRETTRIHRDAIRRIKGQEGTVLRDRVLPVYRLRSLLDLEPRPGIEEEYALIIEVEGEEAALIVDRLSEGMDVILKPLAGLMEGIPLYRGTTMLGDGRILLILDIEEILRCQ